MECIRVERATGKSHLSQTPVIYLQTPIIYLRGQSKLSCFFCWAILNAPSGEDLARGMLLLIPACPRQDDPSGGWGR